MPERRLPKMLHFYVDTELGILHSDFACPGMKMAKKYRYFESHAVSYESQAVDLDSRYKPCPRCQKIEQRKRSTGDRRFRYVRGGKPE